MCTIIVVIIVKIIFISSFLFYCLLCKHSFPTNPNSITNCLNFFLYYNLQLHCSCVAILILKQVVEKVETVFKWWLWAVSIPILIKSYWNRKYGSRDVTMRPNSVRSLKSIQKYMKDLILTTQNYGKPKIIFSFFWTQWLNCTTNVLTYFIFLFSSNFFFRTYTSLSHQCV